MTTKRIFLWIFCAAVGALAASFFAEKAMHMAPCFLCRVQRAVYFLLIPVSALGLKKFRFARWSAVILLAFGALTGTYHTLVQFGVVKDRCQISSIPHNPEEFQIRLLTPKTPTCSQQTFKIGVIPVPAINAALSLILLLVTLRNIPRAGRFCEFGLSEAKQNRSE